MSTASNRDAQFTAEVYWRVRERELIRKLELVKQGVDKCEAARKVLYNLSETVKIHEPLWEDAQAAAMASLRSTRTNRAALRRMVVNMKDTIRIRPTYAAAIGPKTVELLDTASRLCDYLDAHGY